LKSEHFFWILTLLRVHRKILTPTGNSHTCCFLFCVWGGSSRTTTHTFFLCFVTLSMVLRGLLIKHINWIKHATKLVAMEAVVIAISQSNYIIIHVFVTLSLTLALPKGLHVFGIWEMYLRSVRWSKFLKTMVWKNVFWWSNLKHHVFNVDTSWLNTYYTCIFSGFSRVFFSHHLREFSLVLRVFSHLVRVWNFSGFIFEFLWV
jgi:hypothetical protein